MTMTGTETEAAIAGGAERFRHLLQPMGSLTVEPTLVDLIIKSPTGGAEEADKYREGQAAEFAGKVLADANWRSENNYGGSDLHRSIPFGD